MDALLDWHLMTQAVERGTLGGAGSFAGQRLGRLLLGMRKQLSPEDVDLVRYLDGWRLTEVVADELRDEFGPKHMEQIRQVVSGNRVAAVAQEMLAARFAVATTSLESSFEEELRSAFSRALDDPQAASGAAAAVYDALDEMCSELWDKMSRRNPERVRELRDEAADSLLIATVERMGARLAKAVARGGTTWDDDDAFVRQYRAVASGDFDYIEIPSLDRPRVQPFDETFVPPRLLGDGRLCSLPHFASRIDRTVLLGRPGGGKSTVAAAVCRSVLQALGSSLVPFLVVLRTAMVDQTDASSIPEVLARECNRRFRLGDVAQIERLLENGQALVVFDGLDELGPRTRRADIAKLIAAFGRRFPLAKILVTCRQVAYEAAPLPSKDFDTYVLDGFSVEQVQAYAQAWFHESRGEHAPAVAKTFLDDSAIAPDLRRDPLTLALMCEMYRGKGSLPRNRPLLFEKCATMLFEKWDTERGIALDYELRGRFKEALAFLALWMVEQGVDERGVSERTLHDVLVTHLMEGAYTYIDLASRAVDEFLGFCKGRLWVFTEVARVTGFSEHGEPIEDDAVVGFAHRTFFEYFAAVGVSRFREPVENHVDDVDAWLVSGNLEILAELVLLQDNALSNGGGDRLLSGVLAKCESAAPSPGAVGARLEYAARALALYPASTGVYAQFIERCLEAAVDARGFVGRDPYVVPEKRRSVLHSLASGVDHGDMPREQRKRLVVDTLQRLAAGQLAERTLMACMVYERESWNTVGKSPSLMQECARDVLNRSHDAVSACSMRGAAHGTLAVLLGQLSMGDFLKAYGLEGAFAEQRLLDDFVHPSLVTCLLVGLSPAPIAQDVRSSLSDAMLDFCIDNGSGTPYLDRPLPLGPGWVPPWALPERDGLQGMSRGELFCTLVQIECGHIEVHASARQHLLPRLEHLIEGDPREGARRLSRELAAGAWLSDDVGRQETG